MSGYDLILDETDEKVYRNGKPFTGTLFLRGPGNGPIWQHIAVISDGAYSHDSEYALKNWTICFLYLEGNSPETGDSGYILLKDS